MLKSMTGFGEGTIHTDDVSVVVELRSVNNRYLKVNTKLPDKYAKLETEIERTIREKLTRGTVAVSVRVQSQQGGETHRLNVAVIQSYLDQLRPWGEPGTSLLGQVLLLPGVVEESVEGDRAERDAPAIGKALATAIDSLEAMRRREGEAMKGELLAHGEAILKWLDVVTQRLPSVMHGYRDRLLERVSDLLNQQGVTVSPADLIREVSIYAERSDVAEEMARLKSHVAQFRQLMDVPEPCGRKLDFLSQEMFRECNTLGSKSADPEISQAAIELKSIVERIREMIANVE